MGVKANISIFFGHENWNLVLNMMIGIRTSIKGLYPTQSNINDNEEHEFKLKGHYELIQRRTSNFDLRKTCNFIDYAPKIFELIRKKFNISNEEYLRSVGPEQLLVCRKIFKIYQFFFFLSLIF